VSDGKRKMIYNIYKNIPANAHGKGSVLPHAALYDGHLAPEKAAGSVEDLVAVAVVSSREAIVGLVMGVVVVAVDAVVGVGDTSHCLHAHTRLKRNPAEGKVFMSN
jgi:hypothetical protein